MENGDDGCDYFMRRTLSLHLAYYSALLLEGGEEGRIVVLAEVLQAQQQRLSLLLRRVLHNSL